MGRLWRFPVIGYVARRVEGRERLEPTAMARTYFAALPFGDVVECLEFLHSISLPMPLLRPEDRIIEWLEPPETWNPLKWFVRRTRYETVREILFDDLEDEIRRHGWDPAAYEDRIWTLGDIVRAWCGEAPTNLVLEPTDTSVGDAPAFQPRGEADETERV